MEFTRKELELAFNNNGRISDFTSFVKSIEYAREQDKVKRSSVVDVYLIFPDTGGEHLMDFIDEVISENNSEYARDQSDVIPDEGVNYSAYIKIGDKIYKCNVFCEAEWCGEWSMRCNIPGSATIKSFGEVKNYEVVKEIKNNKGEVQCICIKLK
jgi:hypothetical protein